MLIVVLASALIPPAARADAAAEIRPIATIRGLTADEADGRIAVTIRGVVTAQEPSGAHLTVQDATGGIWVPVAQARDRRLLETEFSAWLAATPGTEVEIDGVTDQGGFAPMVLPIRLRVVGPAPLPTPAAIDDARLFSGCDSCLRVEVAGVVQGFRDPEGVWQLLLARGGRRFEVKVPKTGLPDPASTLVDAEVRCTGVLFSEVNGRGEFLLPVVHVAAAADLRIETPPQAGPFETRRVALRSIGHFRPEPLGDHRVSTEGIVTFCEPGQFYVQEGAFGVRVCTPDSARLEPGDRVEIAGFLERGQDAAGLQEAVYRVIGHGEMPAPARVDLAEVIDIVGRANRFGRGHNAGDLNGCLVEFPARLLAKEPTAAGGALTLAAEGVETNLTATVGAEGFARLRAIQPGSDLLLRGILQVETETSQTVVWAPPIERLLLLMRDARDVTVVRSPPWWTPGRLAAALSVAAALAAGALAWAAALRRQVAFQTDRLAGEMRRRRDAAVEFQATLRERSRLAANLHDTLLQSLAGVLLQLDALRQSFLRRDLEDADGQLDVAKRMVRRAAVDLRGSVWALRTAPLAGRSFVESLEAIATHLGDGQRAAIDLRVAGPAFEPPRFVAGGLLLAVQEALRNALNHGRPATVEVLIDYGADGRSIAVTVRDDGDGFVPGSQAGPNQGHFGIQGMRERAESLGGSCAIDSGPGRGTTVVFRVPIREHDDRLEDADSEQAVSAS